MAPSQPDPTQCILSKMDSGRAFWEEARWQRRCAHCGRAAGDWDAHHVMHKQHCRVEGAPQMSPDDSLRVCSGGADRCHERHTTGQERLLVADLRDENIAFMRRWLGAGAAYEYLGRYYSGDDPRRDRLLEES
jgi:hypothetical protein